MASSVEQIIAELERERSNYAVSNFEKSITDALRGDSMIPVSAQVESLKKKITRLDPNHPEEMQQIMDNVVSDVTVPESKIGEAFDRVVDVVRDGVSRAIDETETIFGKVKRSLETEADPFRSPEAETSMLRFMTEMTVVGGIGKKYGEVISGIERAIETDDKGALAFWSRNGRKLFDDAAHAENRLPSALDDGGLFARLDAAVHRARSYSQQRAREKLTELETAWQEHEMDGAILGARLAVRSKQASAAGIPVPRPRTDQERNLADWHEKRVELAERGNRLGVES